MEKDELEKISDRLIAYVKDGNPTKAAEMQAYIDKRHIEQESFQKKMVHRYITEKLISLFLILLFILSVGVIIFLFTQSIFEGFVALLIFIFVVTFLSKN